MLLSFQKIEKKVIRYTNQINVITLSSLRIFYLLETTDSSDFVPRVDDGRGFPLGSHQNDIDEIWSRRHRTHLFEVVDRHG